MASNNDFSSTSSNNNNETTGNCEEDVLTVYFSSSCHSRHPGRSCRSAGCRHYRSPRHSEAPDTSHSDHNTPHWARSRTDNWTPSNARDELYQRRIGLLLNFDTVSARNLVGLMGNKGHKDAGVQVSSVQVDGEVQAASRPSPVHAAANAHELSSSKLSFFDVADLSGPSPATEAPPGMVVRRSNSVVRLGLAKEFLREMKECFDSFDKNRDGSISVDELADVMRMLGLEQNQDQLKAMIKAIDRNKNGQIEFGEFVELMKEQWALGEGRGIGSTDDDVERVFRIFDRNNDGKISPDELGAVMAALGEQLSADDLAYMMEVADLDRDGMIDMDEFRNLILLASASAAISPASLAVATRLSSGPIVLQNHTGGSSSNTHALATSSTSAASPARPYNGKGKSSDSSRA